MDEEGRSLEVKNNSNSLSSDLSEGKRVETSSDSLKENNSQTSDEETTDDESSDDYLDSEETESEITDEEEEEETKVNYVKYIAKGAFLVILFYFLLYLVIAYADKNSKTGQISLLQSLKYI